MTLTFAILAYESYSFLVAAGGRGRPATYREREDLLGQQGLATDLSISNSPITMSVEDLWQTGPYCGANCVYAWLTLKGVKVQYHEIKSKVRTEKKGANLAEMKKVGQSYGFKDLEVFDVPEESLALVRRPFIAMVKSSLPIENLGHYIVVSKVDNQSISAIDGTSAGYDTFNREVFARAYSGYVLAEGVAAGPDKQSRHFLLWCAFALVIGGNAAYSTRGLITWASRGRRQ